MHDLKIETIENVNKNNRLIKLINSGYGELIFNDYIESNMSCVYWGKAIYIKIGHEPVSIITYNINDEDLFINLSYTYPCYRKNGYYSVLYNELLKICKEKGIKTITSGIAKTNKLMTNIAVKQGRVAKVDYYVGNIE